MRANALTNLRCRFADLAASAARVEVALEAGDALLFVDSVVRECSSSPSVFFQSSKGSGGTDGSGMRQIPGARRSLIMRYGVSIAGAWQPPEHVRQRLGDGAAALVAKL